MNRSSSEGPPRKRFSWRTLFRPAAAAAVTGGLLLGFLAIPAATASAATSHASTTQIGTYVPVTPTRIVDTRPGSGSPYAGDTLGTNQSLTVQVGNLGGVVPANAAVAVLNVTAINPSQAGYLSVNPAGQSGPTQVSNLNFVAGQTVANLVTVPLNGGAISIYNLTGNTDVAVDVFGYYSATPATDGSGLFNATNPYRALGSLQSGAPIGPNTAVPVQVTGVGGVPSGATAVVVNLTAAGGTLPSYLSAYADGTSQPVVSNVNFVAGQTVANRATVPVSSSGLIDVYNLQGTVNVDADITGYYTGSGGTGSAFVPITPQRLTDTRNSTNGTPIASNTTETFNLSNTNIPATATAVATNVTAIAGNAPGYLTVFPISDGTTPPAASDVNWSANQIVPNFTIANTAGTGNVNIYNYIGATTNVAIDAFGYFTPPTAPVTVTATPATIPSGTGSSTITVLVAQPNGTPVANDPVQLTSSGAAGVCGTLTPNTGTTNSAGKVISTYAAGANDGVCTITALEANGGKTGTATVTQGNSIVLSAASPTVPADGTSTDLLTATVTANGNPVVGDVVHFSTGVANPAGACGTLQGGGVATTNNAGQAQLNYIPSTTVGFCPVGAVETATGQTSNIFTINQTAATPTAANMTVTATPASIVANGTSTSTISATVTTATATPVAGDVVSFVVTTANGGTLSTQFATTNASGVATTTYTSSTTVESVTVGATEANNGISRNTTVTQTAPPNVVTLTASPTSVPANGTSTSTLTVTSVNGNGTPGAAQAVILSSTGTCGTISGPAGLTDASGVYSTTYQAGTTSGFCTISATSGGTPATSPVVIDQTSNPVPNPPNTITASATPSTIVGNGTSQSTISVQVLASNSTPVNGDPVSFLLSGSGCGTLSSATGTTNAAGQASVTYTSKAAAGSCTIDVAEANSGGTGSTTVTQTAAQNTVVVAPATATLLASGTATQLFTATVSPALLGGSVANDTVTWTLSGSPSAACGTINPSSGSTGSGTTVSAVYQSSTTSGFCTVTATESATGASNTALVDQTLDPAPITYTTTTTATPASIPGDGVSTSTISTKVLNTGAVPVVGDTVRFTETGTSIGTLSSQFAVTNASGIASVTYTSSKNSSAVATITGTEANAGTSANATVTQTTPPNVITVGANPSSVSPSATSAITVTVTKAGAPVAGDAITFSWSGAGCLNPPVSPLGGTTLANGTFSATYTAPAATGSGSFCTLTAGDASPASGSVQINNTAS